MDNSKQFNFIYLNFFNGTTKKVLWIYNYIYYTLNPLKISKKETNAFNGQKETSEYIYILEQDQSPSWSSHVLLSA